MNTNGNGRFEDDWASTVPPEYLSNGRGSPLWRRAWSATTGQRQASTQGDVVEVPNTTNLSAVTFHLTILSQ